jgi:hypothetical protein
VTAALAVAPVVTLAAAAVPLGRPDIVSAIDPVPTV